MVSEEIAEAIRKQAIKNAVDYGKAMSGTVIGKALFLFPELKSDMKSLAMEVNKIVAEVNRMPKAQLQDAYKPFAAEFEEAEKEKAEKTAKPNMEIEGAERGKVITRAPPEPGGYIQIGNAKQAILSDEIAKMYEGMINLYFDDTNPEKCRQEFVDGIKKDFAWLGIKFATEYYASDYINKVYDAGRKLLKQGDAYVCMCSDEQVKAGREQKKECEHRKQQPKAALQLFEDMLAGKYDEGQAIVRLNGDMHSDNATFRDPTLFRIKKEAHYKQGTKYMVWPTYHINTIVIDNTNGVTDVIRGKEYEIWDDVNKKMLASLGLKPPRFHYEARLRIKGNTTAKRVIRQLLKDGSITGWDDPRLVTIIALRRRGIMPEAIREFVLRAGFSKTDALVPMDMLLASNKKLIDPLAKHLFFTAEPVALNVSGSAGEHAKLRMHPAADYGFREYVSDGKFYVSKEDADKSDVGDVLRLKDFINVKITKKAAGAINAEKTDTSSEKIIQWVPANGMIKCSVLVPGNLLLDEERYNPDSMTVWNGVVEGSAKSLKEHDIVQFERVGYCILDDKKKWQFIFISK